MISVSFQGERGAYSEGAAYSFFGDGIRTVPMQSFAQAVQSTESGETEHTILPVENSIEGSVGESYDLLHATSLKATGEIYHRIEHCLIGLGSLDEAAKVYSHPQALGQCRKFLLEQGIRQIPAYDTAGSVKMVKEMNSRDAACIASRRAAGIYGLPVIRQDIADSKDNTTRFLVLSRTARDPGPKCKTSIIFSAKHEPGSLYRVLERFHKCGINMTKIESRPKKSTRWEYNFFVDFEGGGESSSNAMLKKISQEVAFLKVLGTYPAADAE